MTARILVGRFGAPHGVRGEIRVKSFTADPLALADYKGLSDAQGLKSFRITLARPIKDDLLIVRLAGIADRSSAQALTNVDIYMERSNLPQTDEDEFYHSDLIGLGARLQDGTAMGTILRVLNFGAGDILEIQPEQGDTLLIAFTKANVPQIDLKNGFVTIVPPAETEAGDANADDASL